MATVKDPRAFRTISEVADDLGLPAHVLRFWETRFSQIRPMKRAGGRRFYRPEDVDLLRAIQKLLYEDGFTIRGVQRLLRERGVKAIAALGRATATAGAGAVRPPGFERLPEDDGDDDEPAPMSEEAASLQMPLAFAHEDGTSPARHTPRAAPPARDTPAAASPERYAPQAASPERHAGGSRPGNAADAGEPSTVGRTEPAGHAGLDPARRALVENVLAELMRCKSILDRERGT